MGAKFAAPLAARLVSRPRLTDRLEKGLGGPVTLLSAPAGWGKTLLVGSWLSMRPPDRPFVWITLAVTDDDPRAFWRTVGTGLARAVGEPAAAALRGMDAVTVAELPGLVAGVLDATGPVLVVLDNLHELRSASVHEGLLHLIDRPPAGLHLVCTTRVDPPWPLDRMRLTGGLCELGCPELAFRPLEVAMLLSAAGVALDADRLAELTERTEGWAAALRLAAVQLAGDGDAARFVATFSGDDHSIAGFLLTEVLGRAEPSARDFLGRICVLDLVCADLADAVTGGDDGAVRLGELEASNFFVHAVGRPGRWYHLHRLVADLLRAQLTEPRHRRDLYRRAAEWHRQQGMALEAVRYALRGGLWRFAADVTGVHLVPLAVGGRARELDVELSSTPRDTLWAYPELACALAAARVMQGRGDEVSDLVEVARAGLTDLPTRRAERIGTVLSLIDVGYARFTGDLEAALAACRRVPDDVRILRGLGLVDWHVLRILTLSNLGTAEMWTGEDADAEKHLRMAIETERWGPTLLPHINAKAHLALMNYERGDLETAEAEALSTIDQATGAGWSRAVQAAPAHLALAGVHIDRGDLAEADESLRRVADVGDVAGEPHVQLAAVGLLAARLAGAGELEQALVGMREALRRSENQPIPPRLRDRLLLLVAELCCRRRDRRAAVAALAALHEPGSPEAVFATVRLHLLDGDPQQAERVLAGSRPPLPFRPAARHPRAAERARG